MHYARLKAIIQIMILIFLLSACISAKKRASILDRNSPNSTTNNDQNVAKNPEIIEVMNRKMVCNHRVLEDGDSLRIFLELDIPRLADKGDSENLKQEVTFIYGLLPNYTSREFIDTGRVNIAKKPIQKKNKLFYASFNFAKRPIITAVLILEIWDLKTRQKIVEDVPLSFTITKIREQFGLFDANGLVPRFSQYLLTKDTIQIRNLRDQVRPLYVKYFKHNFDAASPPMALTNKGVSKNLEVDSLFAVNSHQNLNFTRPGLYFVQADTTTYFGLSFYVAERRYPKLSKMIDLIEPLAYITTEEEITQLRTASETKKEMDKFWLKLMSGNVKTAKYIIREYYRRVKIANERFTSYKEGWKTDMGMIYIVYGNPSRVIRANDAEHWFYTQTASFSEIKFSFARKPNQFAEDYYSLVRFPEYEQVWYPIIELWREGKIQ
jgi:GWxTD domain-containing protein